MASILPTITDIGGGDVRVKWANMATSDVGEPFNGRLWKNKTVHIYGANFGGATVVFQGKNGGGNFQTLGDPQGNAISKTAEANKEVLEGADIFRPSVSGGSGVDVTVELSCRR